MCLGALPVCRAIPGFELAWGQGNVTMPPGMALHPCAAPSHTSPVPYALRSDMSAREGAGEIEGCSTHLHLRVNTSIPILEVRDSGLPKNIYDFMAEVTFKPETSQPTAHSGNTSSALRYVLLASVTGRYVLLGSSWQGCDLKPGL